MLFLGIEIANTASQFEIFCNNVRMSNSLVEDIRYKYHRISTIINECFWNISSDTQHSLYVGSYGRGTSIGYSDVDIIVQLPSSYYNRFNSYRGNGQSALLQEVRNVLYMTYPQSSIRGDGQIVSIAFENITFEILPAFLCNDGSFLYPDSNNGGSWKKTNPKPEIDSFNRYNKTMNKNLKRLCRMIRSWNYYNDVGLDGQFIDVTCLSFLLNYSYNDKTYVYYDWMVRDYFDYMHNNCNSTKWNMPGSKREIRPNRTFRNTVKDAYDLCSLAIDYQDKDCMYSACKTWRDIFGTRFPSYQA